MEYVIHYIINMKVHLLILLIEQLWMYQHHLIVQTTQLVIYLKVIYIVLWNHYQMQMLVEYVEQIMMTILPSMITHNFIRAQLMMQSLTVAEMMSYASFNKEYALIQHPHLHLTQQMILQLTHHLTQQLIQQ